MQFLMHYPVKFQRELLVPRLVADWLPMGLSHNCVVQLQNGTDFICHNSTKQLKLLVFNTGMNRNSYIHLYIYIDLIQFIKYAVMKIKIRLKDVKNNTKTLTLKI